MLLVIEMSEFPNARSLNTDLYLRDFQEVCHKTIRKSTFELNVEFQQSKQSLATLFPSCLAGLTESEQRRCKIDFLDTTNEKQLDRVSQIIQENFTSRLPSKEMTETMIEAQLSRTTIDRIKYLFEKRRDVIGTLLYVDDKIQGVMIGYFKGPSFVINRLYDSPSLKTDVKEGMFALIESAMCLARNASSQLLQITIMNESKITFLRRGWEIVELEPDYQMSYKKLLPPSEEAPSNAEKKYETISVTVPRIICRYRLQ